MSRNAWTLVALVAFSIAGLSFASIFMELFHGNVLVPAAATLVWLAVAAFAWWRIARLEDDVFSGRSGLVIGIGVALIAFVVAFALIDRTAVRDFMRGYRDGAEAARRR